MRDSKKNDQTQTRSIRIITKILFTFLLAFLCSLASYSQEKDIETESVTLDNLITFIVEHYNIQSDSTETKNITFLIETYGSKFNTEDAVILKQAFKLLSKRVTENDLISIVMYSNFNGIALEQTVATDVKKLLYTIEHPKSSVKTFENDGIELAYAYAKENYVEESENSVVMVRIPNRTSDVVKTEVADAQKANKANSNILVLTAIALLPEIISVIKD